MIKELLLSIFLLFVSVSPVAVDDVPQGQTRLASVTDHINLLEKVGYDRDDIDIEFQGDSIPFFDYEEEVYALIPSGVDKDLGEYEFVIKNGDNVFFTTETNVVEYDFPEVFQNIAYSPASLTPSELEEVNKSKESLFEALNRRTEEKLWESAFQHPLEYVYITSDFGRKRIYTNYETQHKGTDFRAPIGTPIRPMSEGRVLWTAKEPLYFEGKAIIIDHGQGIASIYMHLNDVLVDQGDFVDTDQIIGETGSTGLSTGPHLHLDMRIGDHRVDPVSVIKEFDRLPRKD